MQNNCVIQSNKNKISKKKISKSKIKRIISKEEKEQNDKRILELVNEYGTKNNWKIIAGLMNNKLTERYIRDRYYCKLIQNNETKEKFSREEDLKILDAINKFGTIWQKIAKSLHNRSYIQIKNHFHNKLKKSFLKENLEFQSNYPKVLFILNNSCMTKCSTKSQAPSNNSMTTQAISQFENQSNELSFNQQIYDQTACITANTTISQIDNSFDQSFQKFQEDNINPQRFSLNIYHHGNDNDFLEFVPEMNIFESNDFQIPNNESSIQFEYIYEEPNSNIFEELY